MSDVLPGVTIETSAADLAIATPISLNTLAVVGTANRGPLNTPTLISNVQKAYDIFGYPDEYDPTSEGQELTLTRGIQLAIDAGASGIYAVRVASSNAEYASRYIASTTNYCAKLIAITKGSWGNGLMYKVEIADGDTTTVGHVASHSGRVTETYSDSLTGSSPYSYLEIISASNYPAEANAANSIRVVYAAGDGASVIMTILHSDAHLFKESGEVDASVEIMEGVTDQFAQTFTTLDAVTLNSVNLRMKYAIASPVTGSCIVAIYATDSDGIPTGSPLGSVTDLWTTLALTTNYTTEGFTFTSPVVLTADTKYAIVVSSTGGWTATADVFLGGFTAAGTNTFTKGAAYFDAAGAGFVASTEIADYIFDTVIEIPEAYCEFVINNWGSAYPTSELKYIRWSTTSTPTDTTITYLSYYTAHSRKVSLMYGEYIEEYWVVDGNDLITDVNLSSTIATAEIPEVGAGSSPDEEPTMITNWQQFGQGVSGFTTVGANGATDVASSDYADGLSPLERLTIHVVTFPGRYERTMISILVTHVTNMSKKGVKHERIAIAGHGYGLTLEEVLQTTSPYDSERLVFVTPGVKRTNVDTGILETLSASYQCTYLGGWLCAGDISESNLGKVLLVSGLETNYTYEEAAQITPRRMIPALLTVEGGIKWIESLTTATATEWREITTVRISDYVRYSLRSALAPFVGRKNLPYQQAAMKSAITRLFNTMDSRDMLDKPTDGSKAFTVNVSSTDEQKAQGIVEVIVTFKPVKAIKYIQVKAFLK